MFYVWKSNFIVFVPKSSFHMDFESMDGEHDLRSGNWAVLYSLHYLFFILIFFMPTNDKKFLIKRDVGNKKHFHI